MASQVPIPKPEASPRPPGHEDPIDKILRKVKQEPLVPIGIAATIAALTLASVQLRRGNSKEANRYFRYRVYAQGFTVAAAVGGMLYYGTGVEQKGARIEAEREAERLQFEERLADAGRAESLREAGASGARGESKVLKGLEGLDLRGTTWENIGKASDPVVVPVEKVESRAPVSASGKVRTKDPMDRRRPGDFVEPEKEPLVRPDAVHPS